MEFQATRIENKDLCNVLLKWVSIILIQHSLKIMFIVLYISYINKYFVYSLVLTE